MIKEIITLLIAIGLFLLTTVSVVSAVVYNSSENGFALPNDVGTDTGTIGYNITMGDYDMNISSVCKPAASGTTKALIRYADNNSQLEIVNYVGDWATFPAYTTLLAHNNYTIAANAAGASYELIINNGGATYPHNIGNITLKDRFALGANQAGNILCFNLSYDNGIYDNPPLINITSPKNYTSLYSHDITFNITAKDDINLTSLQLFSNTTSNWTLLKTINFTTTTLDINWYPTYAFANGTYLYGARAFDNANQTTWTTNYTLFINAPVTHGIFYIDLTSQVNIIIIFFVIILALFLFFIGYSLVSGVIFELLGLILMFNSFNIIISFLFLIGGIVLIFRQQS